jgi:omega-amidase
MRICDPLDQQHETLSGEDSMKDLRITLVQGDTRWHDPAGNREYYGDRIAGLRGTTDLVLLPETFTSGFSNDAIANAETMGGPTVAWIREQARSLDAAVCGSVQLRDGDDVYNRLLFATPDGELRSYDKRHLFRFANEHKRYAAGRDRLTVEWRGWRICPLVCYDLRFPVFSRNRYDVERAQQLDYDLLLYVANWPSARAYPWKTLLRARAIENLCYVAGLNRVGNDGNGLHYAGDSAVIDFLGHPVSECGEEEVVVTTTLQAKELAGHRERFPAMLDGDRFELI